MKLTFNFFIKKVNFFSGKILVKSQNTSLRFFFNKFLSEDLSLSGFSGSKYINDVVDFSISYYYEFFNRSVYNYHSDPGFLIKPNELNTFMLGHTYGVRDDRTLNFSSDWFRYDFLADRILAGGLDTKLNDYRGGVLQNIKSQN